MNKLSFTLIEVLVTVTLVGICVLLSMNIFLEGYRQNVFYRNKNAIFFDSAKKDALAKKMLEEYPGECKNDGNYIFYGEKGDSLKKVFPYIDMPCSVDLKTGRSVVRGFIKR